MKFFLLSLIWLPLAMGGTGDLRTISEKSNWKTTGRAIETEILCKAFKKKYPRQIECKSYGKSPEGRNLLYVVAGDRNPKNPVIWVQAGIHAGEIDGKDAVFWLLRDILEGKYSSNPLKGITMIFIPIVNIDGHERFGKWNRPNQVGPEEMGWRTTAQNLNMNRDFMKADTPEMQALLKLWVRTNPTVSMDLHVTDGAQFQPEIGIIVTPTTHHGDSSLHKAGKALENGLMEKMKNRGHLALPFYPSFEESDRPASGFSRYVSTPRFSQGYWFIQNRIGVLVESHSWKDYATRVKSHYSTVLSTLELMQLYGAEWKAAGEARDKELLAGQQVPLLFKHTEKARTIDFPGFKYTIAKSDISGALVIKYYPDRPETWKVPLYEELKPMVEVRAPQEGYFISPIHAKWLVEKLNVHGIKYQSWKGSGSVKLEVFRATKKKFSEASFEGHQQLTVEGEWKVEDVQLLPGTIFIPLKQKKALLIMQLLEPMAPDSYLSWGFFNAFFEQKEYMEDYVTVEVAKEMLRDPKIKSEFEARLEDKDFAKDPARRLEFFYRKHPSWDTRYNSYPIFRK